jgi:hypothetical protein
MTTLLTTKTFPVHSWYQYQTLGFEPEFVSKMLSRFDVREGQNVLDPFCGSGTTLVQCMAEGIHSYGIEAHPFMKWVSTVKASTPHCLDLIKGTSGFLDPFIRSILDTYYLSDNYTFNALFRDSKKSLVIKDSINDIQAESVLLLSKTIAGSFGSQFNNIGHSLLLRNLALLALARTIRDVSNLVEKPEVTVDKRKVSQTHNVPAIWHQHIQSMKMDLLDIYNYRTDYDLDRFSLPKVTQYSSVKDLCFNHPVISFVITSPPYLCEKDYTRQTRLESVLLNFLDKEGLQRLKQELVISNSKSFSGDNNVWPTLEMFVTPAIKEIADEIELTRSQLNKRDGFSRRYPDVVLGYFEQMGSHLANLRSSLSHGAKLAYVLGDQASYFGIPIHTANLLAPIAESLGYGVDGIEVKQKRKSFSKIKDQWIDINENILFLTYLGGH